MPVFISLILARKCGVDSPRITEVVQRSMDHYIHDFLIKGALPYGNHGPEPDAYNNNGSSGSLAIALAALGHVEGARFFSRMSAFPWRKSTRSSRISKPPPIPAR